MSEALWDELVASALLGTERRRPSRPVADSGALGQALDGLPWEGDAEHALLGAAALVTGFRGAGWQPPTLAEPPAPAPPDARPLCSPGAAAILAQLLEDGPASLLPDWLGLAQAAGVRPPPEQLPALLDARVAGSMRAAVLQAGGDRLRWLAAHDARWSWAAGGAAAEAGTEERWETGTRDQRLALLTDLRSEDAARGRELLESTWAGDGAQDRATFLQALAVGLEPDDEPFLESALDDRSKLVREQAARLLAGLPSSALSARMAQRLEPLVAIGGRLRRRLVVQTPPEPDDAARRDGIADGGRPHDLGPGAWHLAQLVGAAPLSLWRQVTGQDAPATYALARGADHAPALRLGWALAAHRQRDADWAAVIVSETGDPELLEALSPGAADEVVLALLAGAPDAVALGNILERIPQPWSVALSRAAIGHLARTLTGADSVWGLRLSDMAHGLHLDTREAALAAFGPLLESDLPPAVRRALADLLGVLDLRQTMTRELTPR
jgi:hypothetical protein